jgi:membrane protein required for colicin V production
MNALTTHALSFGWVDYFILIVILFSTLISLMRGFISEAISLLTWIIAAVVAFKFTHFLSDLLSRMIHNPSLRFMISFIILFIVILIIGSILNHFLAVMIRSSGLSSTNRVLGMIFGFARGVLLIAIFILFAKMTSIVREPWWQSSALIPYFHSLVAWLQQFIPVHFNNMSHYFSNVKGGSQ